MVYKHTPMFLFLFLSTEKCLPGASHGRVLELASNTWLGKCELLRKPAKENTLVFWADSWLRAVRSEMWARSVSCCHQKRYPGERGAGRIWGEVSVGSYKPENGRGKEVGEHHICLRPGTPLGSWRPGPSPSVMPILLQQFDSRSISSAEPHSCSPPSAQPEGMH